jgi:hypothetical protein
MHSSIPWEKRTPLHAQAFYNSTIEGRRYRVDGYPKRYMVLDPFYSSRSVPNDLT